MSETHTGGSSKKDSPCTSRRVDAKNGLPASLFVEPRACDTVIVDGDTGQTLEKWLEDELGWSEKHIEAGRRKRQNFKRYELVDEPELFDAARNIFGIPHRVDKCIEECAELIVALRHYPDKKSDNGDVMVELADVFIAISQMVMLYKQGPDDFDTVVNKQLSKLRSSVKVYRGF